MAGTFGFRAARAKLSTQRNFGTERTLFFFFLIFYLYFYKTSLSVVYLSFYKTSLSVVRGNETLARSNILFFFFFIFHLSFFSNPKTIFVVERRKKNMTSILRATQILFWLVTASTHAAPQLVFDPPPCIFTIQDRIYDLSAFRNVVVSGFEDNGAYVQTSLCGDLPLPCVDTLTKVKINGSTMLYTSVHRLTRCWDTVAQWVLFPPMASPLDSPAELGLDLRFSRPGDAHLDCDYVNVSVSARCNASMSPAPRDAVLSGRQIGCSWQLEVLTAADGLCSPTHRSP